MYDLAIIGGGIVGLATGWAICQRWPRARLLLLEKEPVWGFHQTGHNSGVIHSGIYYRPGSLKARLAREGNQALTAFCRTHGIPYEICGKVIVASEAAEHPLLETLYRRGLENGIPVRKISPGELREIEPHVRGTAAIHVLSTGIVDYRRVCDALATLLADHGAELRPGTPVRRIFPRRDGMELETPSATFHVRFLINCAGLHSDRIARMAGERPPMKIIPFRGDYYRLKPERQHLVKHLVYPVPNPLFPFLGVHFTRMMDGRVEAGPNAVVSLKREGYRKTDIGLRDAAEVLIDAGFWRLVRAHWREGSREFLRSLSKAAFVRSLQRLIPEITADDLEPAPSGVRAQAVSRDGQLVDDFAILRGPRSIHVCNAPSPAATAALPIGRTIAGEARYFLEG